MSALTWDTARAGGFVAYALITLSVALGLALSMRWHASWWPRWATNDLHRYVSLLAITFTGIHGLALWLDPFMAFRPLELLLPGASHYRPLWTALGIVAAYLMGAIWLSERLQPRVGYEWWRRLHYLTFAVYALATIHGVTSGSDSTTAWAVGIYASSLALVGALIGVRLLLPGRHAIRRPKTGAAALVLTTLAIAWVTAGVLRPSGHRGGPVQSGQTGQPSVPAPSNSGDDQPVQTQDI